MSIEAIIGITYWVGAFVAMVVIRHRAGVGQRRIKILGERGFGIVWFSTAVVCTMFWPITLVVWLVRGCPEPRVVFNEKAIERQQRHRTEAA